MWLLIAFITVLSHNSFADPMAIDKPTRHVKFNLVIDVIAAQMVSAYSIDEIMHQAYEVLEINIQEPDSDFIMLDREDFEE